MISRRNSNSGVRQGLFQVAGELSRAGTLTHPEQQRLDELRAWFGTNLPVPKKWIETERPGYLIYQDEFQNVAEAFSDTGA